MVDSAVVVAAVRIPVFAVLMAVQQMTEPDFRLNLVAMLFDLVLLRPLLVSNSPGDLQQADDVVAELVDLQNQIISVIITSQLFIQNKNQSLKFKKIRNRILDVDIMKNAWMIKSISSNTAERTIKITLL